MARVVFNTNETDQQFQIEDGIQRTLQTSNVASVDQDVINKCYELYDSDGKPTEATIQDRCARIADECNVDYSLHENLVVFRRKAK